MKTFAEKSLIIFDLDGTLAESKQVMDHEMTTLIAQLLLHKKVAVISGGSFAQFQKQFLPALQKIEEVSAFPFSNLFLLPTSGSALYFSKNNAGNNWSKEYSHDLSAKEIEKVHRALAIALTHAVSSGVEMPLRTYGETVEDRGGQITYSADGQDAPIEVKAIWDPDEEKRQKIAATLRPLLPEFSVNIGGMTSIDITKKGIDKAFGVRKICEHLKIPITAALYIGDALFPGGNDYAARASGVECMQVGGVSETKKVIHKIIASA
jgi:HAD superfamily hydrolase (TIGR01484 family)